MGAPSQFNEALEPKDSVAGDGGAFPDEFEDFEPGEESEDEGLECGPHYLISTRKQRLEYI